MQRPRVDREVMLPTSVVAIRLVVRAVLGGVAADMRLVRSLESEHVFQSSAVERRVCLPKSLEARLEPIRQDDCAHGDASSLEHGLTAHDLRDLHNRPPNRLTGVGMVTTRPADVAAASAPETS